MFNTNVIVENAFRIARGRGESVARIRIPGGHLKAGYLDAIRDLAVRFGNGTVHLTTRQGFEVPGIRLKDIEAIRQFMAPLIAGLEKDSGVRLDKPEQGYPAAGTRNVAACIGNRVCRFANCDTTALAQRIEAAIYPNHYHLKVAVTGCPNDCIKAHMHDIGIIGQTIPNYTETWCIGCEACIENCRKKIANALSFRNYGVEREDEFCIRCGECALKCPTGAMSRGRLLYRIILGGRTGKRNPRLANTFVTGASEDVVMAVCRNVYRFIHIYIDRSLPKEHLGYIIDRAGFEVFRGMALADVQLNNEAWVDEKLSNPGYFYPRRNA